MMKCQLRILFVLLATSVSGRVGAAEKPNIIYLMLDEWGYFESGHMGHPEPLVPNIDLGQIDLS